MSAGAHVSLTHSEHVGVVTLTRPQALNAISSDVAEQLADAFRTVAADEDVWVLLLQAEGDRAFCVGADLKERASFTLADFHSNRKKMRAMFEALRGVPQPAIAAVFGFTLGGGLELALSCDIVVAADDAEVGLPEASVGLLPAGGATQLLPRRVGTARAKELMFTGRRISASEAERHGLVERVVPRAALSEEATALAQAICRCSPVATRAAKAAIDRAFAPSPSEGIEVEHGAWSVVIASRDRAEGIAAFNERRSPDWSNR